MDIPSIGSSIPTGQIAPDRNANIAATAVVPDNISQPQPTTPPADPAKAVDKAQLQHAVSSINKSLQDKGQDVRFSVDQDSKRVVVKIIDQNTNQVLRQIPTEQALEISQSLDKLQGLLIKQEV
ncbi:flagellar protein FlaG [Undibacterium sp. Dicai25W]|uniref:flagellar protein FlaG n=1 Tax=Undibacterium sp. Dicai25W TaxID=3413034 RepID=UPI003BF37947